MVHVSLSEQEQIIDGFGAHQGDNSVNQNWWQQLFYSDMRASIYRVDLTPQLVSPYSDLSVYSPWFMGSGTDHVFNLEDLDNPDGPEGNRVRTYTGPEDYSRLFGGENAPIAVMGPDIDFNVDYFTYSEDGAIDVGLAQMENLGDFKLIGSFWSPVPWVKVSSGNAWNQNWWPGPVQGAEWPFIWGGNYAGGRLDVSGTPLAVFDDSALGGDGPTSSITQFARSAAAYVRGYQQYHNVPFYAISIQNELNFEEFYNSATYPLSAQYIAALKAVRSEFDRYDDLKDIRIMGPEDLLGGNAYGMWQYGSGGDIIHKNLQYLQNLDADPEAMAAIDFFCIHGYGSDGVSASGATSTLWDWWVNGWEASPAPGIPGNVAGYASFNKKSWMTETSGENPSWLFPANGYPNNGGWSVALRIHQALTTGRQSAWVYWTFAEDDNGNPSTQALTNQILGANSPKYVAAKHYFRYIRPNAYRVNTTISGAETLLASAYAHDINGSLTIVLINTSANAQTASLEIPEMLVGPVNFEVFTSSSGNYWQESAITLDDGSGEISVPGYGVVTLYGQDAIATAVEDPVVVPLAQLFQNQPNPFSASTSIRFNLSQKEWAELSLFDARGRTLNQLVDEVKTPGSYEIPIDGVTLNPGVYFYQLKVGAFIQTKKMVVLKK
ncbi:MAG: hypothetical protein DHS20C18_00900 [Saprospiraceae bacterium]|nr:MAG: hypothetical protein DHS20C18_00900 [Saprospiraceae bacterium]